MRAKTARRYAVVLLATLGLSPLGAAEKAGDELAQTQALLVRCDDGSLHPPENGAACDQALDRFWELMRESAVGFLSAHPEASAREVQADLSTRVDEDDQRPSAVRLSGDAVAVSIAWGFYGDVFVVSRAPAQPFTVTWDLRALSEKGPPDGELAAWSYAQPGIHSGPYGGRVLALPPTRAGRPRFLVDAVQHPRMGAEVPGQTSVWEWTRNEVAPELIKTYVTASGLGASLRGDRVLVRTKERLLRLYTCGMCEDPRGTWTLRITPDGVTDLGHRLDEPLLLFVDDLLNRLVHHQDAAGLASPRAWRTLERVVEEMSREDAEPVAGEPPREARDDTSLFGMLMEWKVSAHGKRRRIDLSTDRVHLLLTVAQRAGKPYVTAVETPGRFSPGSP